MRRPGTGSRDPGRPRTPLLCSRGLTSLGLPFISAPPVGVHEKWNLRWGTDGGAALPQHDPATAGEWLQEWLEDGVLAGAAWAGYQRLPQLGLYRIAEELAQHG